MLQSSCARIQSLHEFTTSLQCTAIYEPYLEIRCLAGLSIWFECGTLRSGSLPNRLPSPSPLPLGCDWLRCWWVEVLRVRYTRPPPPGGLCNNMGTFTNLNPKKTSEAMHCSAQNEDRALGFTLLQLSQRFSHQRFPLSFITQSSCTCKPNNRAKVYFTRSGPLLLLCQVTHFCGHDEWRRHDVRYALPSHYSSS
jgi:hypothetical protein